MVASTGIRYGKGATILEGSNGSFSLGVISPICTSFAAETTGEKARTRGPVRKCAVLSTSMSNSPMRIVGILLSKR